jgi:hypothetical protein
MKQYIAAALTVLLCMSVVVAAQEKTAEAKGQESSVTKDPKKDSGDGAATKSEEVHVKETPFGTVRTPISTKPPVPKAPPSLGLFEIEEKGAAVTFKKKTPFGVTSWTKQQTELTDQERRLIADYKASKAGAGTAGKPEPESSKPGVTTAAKVKSETNGNKKP